MAMQKTVTVCWTPDQSASTHAFLDDKNVPYPDDVIPVTDATAFTFVISKACSDSKVYPFTMTIAPSGPANDVTVVTNAGPKIVLNANYKAINQRDQLRMTLQTSQEGGKNYTIESGKPIIRNDPHRTFDPVYMVAGLILALVVVTAIVLIMRSRMHPD